MPQTERKFDINKLIGILLIGFLFIGYLYISNKKQKEMEARQATEDSISKIENPIPEVSEIRKSLADSIKVKDSIQAIAKKEQDSALAITLSEVESEKMRIHFSNKGAQIKKLELKEYKKYNKSTKLHTDPLYLINESSVFDLILQTSSGQQYHTKDLTFALSERKEDSTQVVEFSTPIESGNFKMTYRISPTYEVALDIDAEGLSLSKAPEVNLNFDAFQLEKGRSQEMYYTDLHYAYDNYDDLSYKTKSLDSNDKNINWFCIKQQFFLNIIESESGFINATSQLTQTDMPNGVENEHLKNFKIQSSLGNEAQFKQKLKFYFLPMNLDILKQEEYASKRFDDLIPFDYLHSGIIGWINKNIFYNIYKILSSWGIAAGWVIFLMTIIIKLMLSPIMFKQHKNSAMMRALKPDIEKLNEKYKDDPLKKQQETMSLYSKVGASPFSGCLPALLQIPLFMALFRLFPNIFQMRGKSFLWAEDLTAYDSIYSWEQYIPVVSDFYGNHISLFALLYAVVLLIYTRMNASNIQQPQQEGMPDMSKIMYIMPLMFVFFLNSYASSLSWYYLVSNALNIVIILVIKKYFIDEEKLHALVEINKKKNTPKKKSRFQKLMDKAAEQQKLQEQQKKKKGK